MNKRTVCGNNGFTLLEVLVALAIVAVGAVGILALNNNLFRLVARARTMDALALLAREVAYEHGTNLRHPVRAEGMCEPPHEDCRWLIATESTDEPGLVLVRLTVDCGPGQSLTVESATVAR